MLGGVSRSVIRRTATRDSLRWASQVPPKPPPPPTRDATQNEPPSSTTPDPSSPPPPPPKSLSNLPSLDFSPPDPTSAATEGQGQGEGGGTQRTGARSSSGTLSSADMQRRRMGRVMLGLFVAGLVGNAYWMGREWEEGEVSQRRMTIEDAPSTRWGRMKRRYGDFFDMFSKPAWTELLPPPYPPPHGKPYTLLISIDDLLVTSTWDRQHGWRTAKRPGVDYFLAYISQFYEVVVFTTQNSYTAAPILDKLDPYNFFITHRLFREATRSTNGRIVKDLSYLNRDLSKVILLDTDPDHAYTHPENSVIVPKWRGEKGDQGLVAMIPFLESIAIYKPPDVRPILERYRGKNIPLEYAKAEAEGKKRHIEEWEQKRKAGTASSGGGVSLLSGLFGGRTTPPGPPPTYLELKRAEAQKQYQDEQAYIKANKTYLDSLLEQERKAMEAQMPSNVLEAIRQFQSGGVGAGAGAGGQQGAGVGAAGPGVGQGVGGEVGRVMPPPVVGATSANKPETK